MLQSQTVSEDCLTLIRRLMEIPALDEFRLAGGTALALQKGHRVSIDIDLFADGPFENSVILQALEAYLFPLKPTGVRAYPFGFFCSLQEIKTDFMYWGDAFIESQVIIEGIRMASPAEIFAMKLRAVTSRKVRKDFFDIAVLLETVDLGMGIKFFKKKFPYEDVVVALKQLCFFDEAEKDADPVILIPLSWPDVKERIIASVRKFWNDELNKG